MLERILSRLFKYESINGHDRCPTYLHRWTLLQPRRPRWLWRGFGIYLHKFVGDDWTSDLHDHPKRFISIGLAGGYVEETFVTQGSKTCPCELRDEHIRRKAFKAPWIRTFPANHTHRLIGPTEAAPCWTLVIVLRSVREWGFWSRGRFVPWRDYVAPGNADAERNKVCP